MRILKKANLFITISIIINILFAPIIFSQVKNSKNSKVQNNTIIKQKKSTINNNNKIEKTKINNKNKNNSNNDNQVKKIQPNDKAISKTDNKKINKDSSKKTKSNIKKTNNEKSKKKEDKKKENKQKQIDKEKKHSEWVLKTIKYGIHKDRIEAIKSLLKFKNDKYKQKIIKLLNELMPNEKNPEVKKTAITVLSEINSKESTPWIISSLDDESEDVRIQAIYAIEKLKIKKAIPKLEEKLKESDFTKNSNFIEALIRALGKLKAKHLKDFAIEKIKDINTTTIFRQQFVLFLGDIGDSSSKDFLLKLLKDEDEEIIIRSYAASSLAKINANDASSEILKIANKIDKMPIKTRRKYHTLLMYCTSSLVKLGDKNAFNRLINDLKDNDPVIRLRAIKLLRELKDKRAIDILKYKMNNDPSSKVQKAAKKTLIDMGVIDEKEDKNEKNEEPKSKE